MSPCVCFVVKPAALIQELLLSRFNNVLIVFVVIYERFITLAFALLYIYYAVIYRNHFVVLRAIYLYYYAKCIIVKAPSQNRS